MSGSKNTQHKPYQSQMGLWIVIGAALGVVFAQFVDNYGYGIGLGVALGIVIGAIIDAQNKHKEQEAERQQQEAAAASDHDDQE